jgi:hypothetical protein
MSDGMRRNFWQKLIAAVLFAASSSCCEQQFNHSVRRVWTDYNTFRAPALSFEQFDHLPYPAAQVGYYRWMYDKDPGHQLACLGPVPQPTCVVPQCVPPDGDPFEYQVAFPGAIPTHTDPLWGPGTPEPINVPRGPADASGSNLPAGKQPAHPELLTVPVAPVLPPTETDPRRNESARPSAQPNGAGQAPDQPFGSPSGFGPPPPSLQPVDEDVAPLLGPASQGNPNLRLTTGPIVPAPTPPAATNAIWPR